jgi:hypothetical protein
MRGDVEGLVAADPEIDSRCGDHRLGDGHDLAFGQRRGIGGQPGAQALALRDIEDGEALEEGHRLGVATLAALARSPTLLPSASRPSGVKRSA